MAPKKRSTRKKKKNKADEDADGTLQKRKGTSVRTSASRKQARKQTEKERNHVSIPNEDSEQYRSAALQGMLEEFDFEVEARCKQMRSQANSLALQMRNLLRVEMMKLPLKVRKMSMAEFCGQYGGDLVAVQDRAAELAARERTLKIETPSRRHRRRPASVATPNKHAAAAQGSPLGRDLHFRPRPASTSVAAAANRRRRVLGDAEDEQDLESQQSEGESFLFEEDHDKEEEEEGSEKSLQDQGHQGLGRRTSRRRAAAAAAQVNMKLMQGNRRRRGTLSKGKVSRADLKKINSDLDSLMEMMKEADDPSVFVESIQRKLGQFQQDLADVVTHSPQK